MEKMHAQKVSYEDQNDSDTTHNRLLDAVESFPGGFELFDADGILLFCNEEYCDLFFPNDPAITPGISFGTLIQRFRTHWNSADNHELLRAWSQDKPLHEQAFGTPIEYKLGADRWLRSVRNSTRNGGIIGVHIDNNSPIDH